MNPLHSVHIFGKRPIQNMFNFVCDYKVTSHFSDNKLYFKKIVLYLGKFGIARTISTHVMWSRRDYFRITSTACFCYLLGRGHEWFSSSLSISILLLLSVCWVAVSPKNYVIIVRVRYQVWHLYKMADNITVLYVVLLKRDSKCDTLNSFIAVFCAPQAWLVENWNQSKMWHFYPIIQMTTILLHIAPSSSCVYDISKTGISLHVFFLVIKPTRCTNHQVLHSRCVFMQMRVGGSVKTQLSYDRDLLVWRWLHVSAVLGHLQVISSCTINKNKEKTYTLDKVIIVNCRGA